MLVRLTNYEGKSVYIEPWSVVEINEGQHGTYINSKLHVRESADEAAALVNSERERSPMPPAGEQTIIRAAAQSKSGGSSGAVEDTATTAMARMYASGVGMGG